MRQTILFLMVVTLAGCVGTDYIADPLMLQPARIIVTPEVQALEVGKAVQFHAMYFDSLGNEVKGLTFSWSSSDPALVTLDTNGNARALKIGQARITAQTRNITSPPALLTVVADPNQVASIEVSSTSHTLVLGSTLQFSAIARNLNDAMISGKTFTWRSSNTTVARVNANGLLTAFAAGETNITAEVEGVSSPNVPVTVTSTSRTGAFTKNPSTSYNVSGTATLERQANGALVLRLSDTFSSSNGPGLEVILSTTKTVGANSVNLERLQKTNGAQTYNVPSTVTLTSHDWVLIHCVPFNVTFGYAQLQ